jgi:hypothetical protein
MLLDVQKSKSGDSLVIIDPGGDVHACPSADEFWATVRSIIDDPEMPGKVEATVPPRRRGNGSDDFVGEDDDLVSEVGGRVLQGLLSGLQNISYRGKKRGGAKPPTEGGDGGG